MLVVMLTLAQVVTLQIYFLVMLVEVRLAHAAGKIQVTQDVFKKLLPSYHYNCIAI
jgi:hypothetical protein